MNKELRKKVYNKYQGHCAYCGMFMIYEVMQVDHITPKRYGGTDDIKNLNPSCRLCNHYKRHLDIEGYRERLNKVIRIIRDDYIINVAIKYGMIIDSDRWGWDGKFYFEKLTNIVRSIREE